MWKLFRQACKNPIATLSISLVILSLTLLIAIPLYGQLHWRSANEALERNEPELAWKHLQTCLAIWPKSIPVHLLAARVARLQQNVEASEEHLAKIQKLQGGASEATQLEFLLIRAQSGEVEEVTPALFAYVDRDHPESELILETIARANMHHLRYGPSFVALNRLIEVNPNSAKAYHWRGWILERMNKPKLGMQEYLKALEIDPDLFPVRLRVAEMELEDSNAPKALIYLEPLYEEYPERAEVKARMGQCRFLQGRHDEARALLLEAIEELPKDFVVLLHLAKIDLLQKRPVEAEKWLRRILEEDPGDTEAYYTLVSCLQQQGRKEEAAIAAKTHEKMKMWLDRANKLLRDEAEFGISNAENASEIGRTLLELRQDRLGLHWLNEAIKRDPNHRKSHEALAVYYEAKGDSERAAFHRRYAPVTKSQ